MRIMGALVICASITLPYAALAQIERHAILQCPGCKVPVDHRQQQSGVRRRSRGNCRLPDQPRRLDTDARESP